MNDKEEKDLATISTFFAAKSNVTFAYRYFPIKDSGYQPMVKYEIAFHLDGKFSPKSIFDLQLEYLHDLHRLLHTDNLILVPINTCPVPYQQIIVKTGKVIFIGDERALDSFKTLHHQLLQLYQQ